MANLEISVVHILSSQHRLVATKKKINSMKGVDMSRERERYLDGGEEKGRRRSVERRWRGEGVEGQRGRDWRGDRRRGND